MTLRLQILAALIIFLYGLSKMNQPIGKFILITFVKKTYCKLRNFRENFLFAKSFKSHICDVKNLRQGHDLTIPVNDKVIAQKREDFIFTKLRICKVRES